MLVKSTSKTVVTCAEVCLESTMCWAIFLRIIDSGSTRWFSPAAEVMAGRWAGCGRVGGCGGRGSRGFALSRDGGHDGIHADGLRFLGDALGQRSVCR